MRILVGTSGFSYPAWKGSFYPRDLPARRMLAWYASRLSAVEVNNTFHRMPQPRLLAGWRAEVPDGFAFAIKAPQHITHAKRLQDVDAAAAALLRAVGALGPARGPVLFQLPPQLKVDVARLRDFLALLPPGVAALEFRDPSWFREDVLVALADRGAALVANESGDLATPLVATGTFGYLRLRRATYSARELGAWAERIAAQPWRESYVFFKHEDEARGPGYALALSRLVGAEGLSAPPLSAP